MKNILSKSPYFRPLPQRRLPLKHLLQSLVVLLATILLAACEIDIDDSSGKKTDDPYGPAPDPTDRSYGFGEPVEIHNENYDLTFQYKDDTRVVKTQDWQWIDHVEADTIIYFLSGMPEKIRPRVGFPLVLELPENGAEEILEKVPSGFRNMVLELTEADGLLRCVTTIAPLNEIYETFEWDGGFSVLDQVHTIKLTDDLELPLERTDLSDFGEDGERNQKIGAAWNVSDIEEPYSFPRLALSGSRAGETQDNVTYVRHYREPYFKKLVLGNEALRAYIEWGISQIQKNSEVLNIPEGVKTLIKFISITDVVFTLYVSCDYYTTGNIRTGEEYNFLEPGIALDLDFTVGGAINDVDEKTWGDIVHNQDVKDFFAETFREFNLFKSIPVLLPPVVFAPAPIVLNVGLGVRADAEFKISGKVSLSGEIFKFSLPINLNANLQDPKTFSMPKLTKTRFKSVSMDGSAGLHLIPALDVSVGVNSPPFIHFLVGPKFGVDYDFFSLDVQKEEVVDWSFDPSLTYSISATFKATAELDLGGVPICGMKEIFSLSTPRFEGKLFEKRMPILPTPTLPSVSTELINPPTFESKYNLEPGLLLSIYQLYHPVSMAEYLSRLLGWKGKATNVIQAGIQVLDYTTREVVGNYYNEYPFDPKEILVKTHLTGLDSGKKYLARPVMRFMDIDIPYKARTTQFPSETDSKKLTYIGGFLMMQYDDRGRPYYLMDLLEGGVNKFFYGADGSISFRYEEDEDYFQSDRVETNSMGFITRISGHYDDGEAQDIVCQYSADGHLTYMNNVFSDGDSYTSTYKWKNGLLEQIDWEEDREDDETVKGFSKFSYGKRDNKLNQFTVALCDDRNAGSLLFTGLFGLPPTKLPIRETSSDTFYYIYDLLSEPAEINTVDISYNHDADGAIRQEIFTFRYDGDKEQSADVTYLYSTDDAFNAPQKRSAGKLHRRGPFRSRANRMQRVK